jgi:hypothetical protein
MRVVKNAHAGEMNARVGLGISFRLEVFVFETGTLLHLWHPPLPFWAALVPIQSSWLLA